MQTPDPLRRAVLAVAFVAIAALAGCASVPKQEVMQAETASFQLPKLPSPDRAMVYVVRPAGLGGAIRFNVFVDDKEPTSEMGYTRSSQYIYFDIAPGNHTILSKAENWAEMPVVANAGDVIYIEQTPSLGFIMARNSIARIDELPGRYHVKKLSLGTIIRTSK